MEVSKESPYTKENLKKLLEVFKTHKPSDEPMLAGCRNCGDMFQVTATKQKCNCGNVSFETFNDGGEAKAKQEKAMQKIRSWNQKKKKR